ncbi:hypothetical protein GGR57DRAFT_506630 [Xylariaceae sp. FL1272]|nr:hypothetical protein GGR57DRAFT_506630 [Xylariaceae sp. FL1272]
MSDMDNEDESDYDYPFDDASSDSLQDQLNGGVATADFPRQAKYHPDRFLEKYINEEAIKDYFKDIYPKVRIKPALIDYIMKDAKKLFAIAVTAPIAVSEGEKSPLLLAMSTFKKQGYRDCHLSAKIADSGTPAGVHTYLDKKELELVKPQVWLNTIHIRVCDFQWKWIVPILSTAEVNYNFRATTILPFTKEKDVEESPGGFGRVCKVRIDADYFKDPKYPDLPVPEFFAVKEIIPPDAEERRRVRESWGNEVKLLKEMNTQNPAHIVRCMTAFTMGDKPSSTQYYLVMEWADGGCLEDLFKEHRNPVFNADLMKQVTGQLIGMSEALGNTHIAGIRHGDLKPGNILRFESSKENIIGTLKIGDWGLAKFHSMATVMRQEKGLHTTTRYGTPLYEPPQVQLGEAKQLSRLYDVWSFGVVMLEIIIWIQYGYEGVKRFRHDVSDGQVHIGKPCYESKRIGEDGTKAKVRRIVIMWMNYLAEDCDENTAIGALLSLIRDRLLIVKLPPEMGKTIGQTITKFVEEWVTSGERKLAIRTTAPTGLTPSVMITAPAISGENVAGKRLERVRYTAEEMTRELKQYDPDDDDTADDFWYKERPRRGLPNFGQKAQTDGSGHLSTSSQSSLSSTLRESSLSNMSSLTGGIASARLSGRSVGMASSNLLAVQQQNFLDSEWELHDDTDFASEVLTLLDTAKPPGLRKLHIPNKLCSACGQLDFFSIMPLSVKYSIRALRARSKDCDLCALFLKVADCRGDLEISSDIIRFDKVQSSLILNNAGRPVLTIRRTLDEEFVSQVPYGLPALPRPGTTAHFDIMRQWLRLCDNKDKHPSCHSHNRGSKGNMPTRVLDVGLDGDDMIRLYEPSADEGEEYIALSHPWGHGPHLITDKGNLEQFKSCGIKMSILPGTFRDAVITTRALGKPYLWIDSLCIVQGPGGDFQAQAGRMETVFSSAYCVLAATRAHNQVDGFLQPRRERDYVALRTRNNAGTFHVCENIDDFNGDVLEGHLNRRGWVLQEHALARRTIFFAGNQTYFECGDGVRCETLTKVTNNLAAFLGDPSFPHIIMSATQGEKIVRFQNLYKTYSGLGFTNDEDRAVAMSGIQSRLLRAFGTHGGYGIFDEVQKDTSGGGLLRRSLLWHCPDNKELTRISFTRDPRLSGVPSWSWMAYNGSIDYLKPEFGNIDWADVQSPWSSDKGSRQVLRLPDRSKESVLISGLVRDLRISDGFDGNLFYDIPSETDTDRVRCIVLGVSKGKRSAKERRHYVILVQLSEHRGLDGSELYQRVGAGYLLGRYISGEGERIYIH